MSGALRVANGKVYIGSGVADFGSRGVISAYDTWDYNANMPIVLADLKIDGTMRKVLLQAPKSGFFYVIDRVTGEFISAEKYARATSYSMAPERKN